MLNLWRDFDRIGMPSLLGWDPTRMFHNVTSLGGTSPVLVKHEDELGTEYDADTIRAGLDKGVLTIQAEKRPEAKPRKIALRGGEAAKRLESGESD